MMLLWVQYTVNFFGQTEIPVNSCNSGELNYCIFELQKMSRLKSIYSYNLVMCVIVCILPLRAKFQENENVK